MRQKFITALPGFLLMLIVSIAFAGQGSGDIRLGYIYLDEEGNRSINQSSFNYYDGVGVSLDNFRYNFNNGIAVKSNLSNINLENRRMSLGIARPGLFAVDINSSQFRRIYDFEGDRYTKRNLTSAGISVYPARYLKVFGSGSFNKLNGQTTDLFGTSFITIPRNVDYQRNRYTFGASIKQGGRMIHAEYSSAKFEDKINADRDQSREYFTLSGQTAVPGYEWLVLSGAMNRFENEYDDTGFKIKSTGARGSLLADLPHDFQLNYSIVFNRAGSDSDFVETDNLAHAVYLTYAKRGMYGLTTGYQNDINDDYEDAIEGNSVYFAGWYMPNANYEFRCEYGRRAENVDDGERLVGDQSRNRFKFYGKYSAAGKGMLKAGVQSINRKRDLLDTRIEFTSVYFESFYSALKYASLSAGYSYAAGIYENLDRSFDFTSHQIHCDIQTKEYQNVEGQAGFVYYRSQRDLDVESFNIHVKLSYRFLNDNRLEIGYRVYNFDDLNFLSTYYTENIVEINVIKAIKF